MTWQQQWLCSTRTADCDTTGTRSTRNRNVVWAKLRLITCFTAHPLQITHFWCSFLSKKLECRFAFQQNRNEIYFTSYCSERYENICVSGKIYKQDLNHNQRTVIIWRVESDVGLEFMNRDKIWRMVWTNCASVRHEHMEEGRYNSTIPLSC